VGKGEQKAEVLAGAELQSAAEQAQQDGEGLVLLRAAGPRPKAEDLLLQPLPEQVL